MKRKLTHTILPLLLSAAIPASLLAADSVTLKNGDHLTGTVTKLDGGKVTLHTAYGGDIVIDLAQVSELHTDAPFVAIAPSGNLNVTGIQHADTNYALTTATGPVTVATLPTLRTPADQKAYEASLHPGLAHNWAGSANVGLALARGNSDTTTFSTGLALARPTLHDKISLYASTLYTHDGIAKTTSAENEAGGFRYDRNLANPKLFAFGTADFYSDALQDLNLRSILGGGFGYHVLKSAKQNFDVFGGVAYTRESYSTTTITPSMTNNYLALDLGEQYLRQFGKANTFSEQFTIYPDLTGNPGQYNFNFNTTLSTKISTLFSWNTTISDVYVSNPPAPAKDNDFVMTTGLSIALTRK